MDKKLIKEDISNMKFLMGYKAGKVISEQEQLEKRYGSFGNMKRPDFKGDEYYDENDRKVKDSELFGISGDDFDTEEFSDFKSYDKKYPKDDENSPNWFGNGSSTTRKKMFDTYKKTTGKPFKVKTRKGEMDEDLEFEEEETMESILEKHNLLDEVIHKGDGSIMIKDKSSEVVQKILSLLPSFTELIFLAILNCESADFSDVDICGLPQILFINLTGTENNFEEQGYECIDGDDAPFYYIP